MASPAVTPSRPGRLAGTPSSRPSGSPSPSPSRPSASPSPPSGYSKQIDELLAFEDSTSSEEDGAVVTTPMRLLPLLVLVASAIAFAGGWFVARAVFAGASPPAPASSVVRHPEGPMKPDPGAIGWTATDSLVGGDHWCQVGAPAASWGLRQCPKMKNKAGKETARLKVLTYNLFWWNLFLQRAGNNSSAGKLIAEAAQAAPFDIMGFQECNDVGHVLKDAKDAGLPGVWRTVGPANPVAGAVAVAWRDDAWKTLNFGLVDVAEDAPEEWWGIRYVAFVRLSHIATAAKVFFINMHGPLPVKDSGGLCGANATAYNLLRVIGYHAQPGDSIVLLGDFNAGKESALVTRLSDYLDHVFSGVSYGGVDNVFATCATAVEKKNLGPGGSDHDALSVVFNLP